MSNVLGELFGDIAEAIREKTGDTATMKPAEFPSKISSIEVGGGGGGSGGGGGGKWTWGTFTGNNAPITINHNLGVVPDVVIVKIEKGSTLKGAEGLYEIVAFLEPKEDLSFSAVAGSGKYGWVLTADYNVISSYTTRFVKQQAISDPIDSADGDPINSANETSFTVGNATAAYYPASGKYNWLAIGGLT